MIAETAYNVINALSEQEKERLYAMLQPPKTTPKKPPKVKRVPSVQDYYNQFLEQEAARKHKKFNKK